MSCLNACTDILSSTGMVNIVSPGFSVSSYSLIFGFLTIDTVFCSILFVLSVSRILPLGFKLPCALACPFGLISAIIVKF